MLAKRREAAMEQPDAAGRMQLMGATLRVIASAAETDGGYSIVEQQDPPGGGSAPHANTREDIVITAVDGTVEIHLGDDTIELSSGRSVSVPRRTRHWTSNAGREPSLTLYTFVPGGFERFFVEAAALGPTPDLDQVAEIAASYGMELAPPGEG
jgi:quercetin dioxygenase-like cupin family protein